MFLLKRSLLVISIVCLSSVLIECVPTKVVSKTSPPQAYVSPSRKLNNGGAFATARSNSQLVAAINERTSKANLTSENLLNSEEAAPVELNNNGNFTTDDVQVTLTNDKTFDGNLSSTEVKPFEDDPANKETANKNAPHNAPSNSSPTNYNLNNDNQPIAQLDTFNTENLGYNSMPENMDATSFQCSSCTFAGYLNSDQISRCCSLGYGTCCHNNANSNLNSNTLNNNYNSNTNSVNGNNANNISPANSNPVTQNSVVNSNQNVQNAPQTVSNKNASPSPPSSPEFYGTKTKTKSTTNKVKSPEQSVDENQDIRQYFPSQSYSGINQINPNQINPNILNQIYMNRFNYANGLNNLNNLNSLGYIIPGLTNNFQYSNLSPSQMNTVRNLMSPVNTIVPENTVASPVASSNANLSPANIPPNPNEMFSRKTLNQNRMGTKTAGASSNYDRGQSISDASVQQSVQQSAQQHAVDQQQQYGFQSKQQPVVQNNENVVQSNVIQSNVIQPITNQPAPPTVNSPQTVNVQQTPQTNTQRINNRNPNEQTATQQQASQGGISNAFSSFISHIPFIGFNPIRIPVVFGSTSQPQRLTVNQMGQIMAGPSQSDYSDPNTPNFPYGTVIGLSPQSQNAQQINPNQLSEQSVPNQNQLQNKVSGNQQTAAATGTNQQQQPANNSGFVATMFSRPMAIYNRLGGYFTRPFGSSKPTYLQYANNQFSQLIPIDMPTDPNLYNLQNYAQYYSPPVTGNQNLIDTYGQINPQLLMQYANMMRSSARKS